jgi:hypothetical protein
MVVLFSICELRNPVAEHASLCFLQVSLLSGIVNFRWDKRSRSQQHRNLLQEDQKPTSRCGPQCLEHGNAYECLLRTCQAHAVPRTDIVVALQVSAMRSLGCACAHGTALA